MSLWVADSGNSRVLEYKAPFTSGMNASIALGQTSLTSGSSGTTSSSLYFPDGLAFDSSGDLWVAGAGNNRVLEFTAPFSTGMQASAVLGQQNFTTGSTSTSQSGMNNPSQVSFGPGGNLWVADSYNNRLLEFSPPFASGSGANEELGQTSYASSIYGGAAALYAPESVAFDSSGNLWAVDTNNNRVVEYSPPLATGMSASIALGHSNLTRSQSATSAAGLDLPFYVTFDASGDLWVSDSGNNRALEYAPPFTTGMSASLVLGQLTLSTGAAQTTPSGLYYPAGLAFDSSGNLWVADAFNSRILEFKAPFTSGMSASLVLGQLSFGSSTAGTSASELAAPVDLAFDSSGNLWVADALNNRVLVFAPPFTIGESASLVIGQSFFTSNARAITQTGLDTPSSLAFDRSGNLWVGDEANNRVLEFAKPFSNSMSASLVLGQSGFTSNVPTTSATGMANPLGLAFDASGNLWVADNSNNRLLEYQAGVGGSTSTTTSVTSSSTSTTSSGSTTSTTSSTASSTSASSNSGTVTISVTTPTFTTTSTSTSTTAVTSSSSRTTSTVPEFPLGVAPVLIVTLVGAAAASALLKRRGPPG